MTKKERVLKILQIDEDPKAAILSVIDDVELLFNAQKSVLSKLDDKSDINLVYENYDALSLKYDELSVGVEDLYNKVSFLDDLQTDIYGDITRIDMDIQHLASVIGSIVIPDVPSIVHGKDGYTPIKGIDYTDGEDGKDGADGDIGPMPKHEWNGTWLRFEIASGEWGEWTNLQGPSSQGRRITGGTTAFKILNNNSLIGNQVKQINFGNGLTASGNQDAISVVLDEAYTDNIYLRLDGTSTMQGNLDVGDFNLTAVSQLQLNTSYTVTGAEPTGSFFWDSDNRTVSVGLQNGVVGQLFKEVFIDGQNDTGSTIQDGTPVAYQGSIGNSGNFRIKLAQASASEAAFYNIGITTEEIVNGATGKITTTGKVRGIQTNGANYGETWNDGDIIYISGSTAGALTNVAPSAPIPAIPVALVISAHATNGTLEVRPTFPQNLVDSPDVNGTPLTTSGQILVWDQANQYFDFTENINNYFYKPGISGGQTAYGGTDAGDDLILDSTSNATKGDILLGETIRILPNSTFTNTVGVLAFERSYIREQEGVGSGIDRLIINARGDRVELLSENGVQNLFSANGPNSALPSGLYTQFGFRAGLYSSVTQSSGGILTSGQIWTGTDFATDSGEAQLHVRDSLFPTTIIERTTTGTSGLVPSFVVRSKTSNNMVDGFAAGMVYQLVDSSGTINNAARVYARRDGSDSTARFAWYPGASEKMTLRASGYLGLSETDPSSMLHVKGSVAWNLIPRTVSTTLGEAVTYPFNCSAGDRVATLPASIDERIYIITRVDTVTANSLTLTGTGGDTIDGKTSILMAPGEMITVQGDGSNWYIIERYRPQTKVRITSADSPYTIPTWVDRVFADTDGGAITVNLYAGSNNEDDLRIINCGGSGFDVTITPNGAELLKGANASKTLADEEIAILNYETTEGWW